MQFWVSCQSNHQAYSIFSSKNKQNILFVKLSVKIQTQICFDKNLFKGLHLKFCLFIQNVDIINMVNYPELQRQTQFAHCYITITVNIISKFPLNIVLNIIAF